MKRFISVLLLAVVLGSPGISGATTWRVEQDGSGDWMTIQAGVLAAADGDTVLIGAGRWSNLFPIWSGSEGVVYWTDAKELYLIGAGTDSTFIGPEEYAPSSVFSVGLAYDGSSTQHIRDISFVNMDYGAMLSGVEIDVARCDFLECEFALGVYYALGGVVENCSLSFNRSDSGEYGLKVVGVRDIEITDCVFSDMGIYQNSSYNTLIQRCVFHNPNETSAVSYVNVGGGVFQSNEVEGGTVSASESVQVKIQDNIFRPSPAALSMIYVTNYTTNVELYRNLFDGATSSSIFLAGDVSIYGRDNHILKSGGGHCIKLYGYLGLFPSTIDLRNNYWGTTDPDTIAAWIWDGNDDPTIQQTVQFEPFSPVPLPTEEQSLDSFKSMFRSK